MKYEQYFIRCSGGECSKKETCERYDAYKESKDKKQNYGKYVTPQVCINSGFKLYEKM